MQAGDNPVDEAAATVYGGTAYGTGEFHDQLGEARIESRCKIQTPTAPSERFGKDRFEADLEAGAVGCPGGVATADPPGGRGWVHRLLRAARAGGPLRAQCITATAGRAISIGPREDTVTRARADRRPGWVGDYRDTRLKVERKIGHLMRHKHGGRRARVFGTVKVDADFRLLAAAANCVRLATLGLRFGTAEWAVTA